MQSAHSPSREPDDVKQLSELGHHAVSPQFTGGATRAQKLEAFFPEATRLSAESSRLCWGLLAQSKWCPRGEKERASAERPHQGAGHTESHDGALPADPAQTPSACRLGKQGRREATMTGRAVDDSGLNRSPSQGDAGRGDGRGRGRPLPQDAPRSWTRASS